MLFSAGHFFDSSPAGAAARKTQAENYVEGEVVAKFLPKTDADAAARKYGLAAELLKTNKSGNLYVLQCKDEKSCVSATTEKIIETLRKNPRVVSVQPNFKYKPLGRIPNDAYFPQEWPLADTTDIAGGVSAQSAWDLETKGQTKVPIALIDSGVNPKHSDLKKKITSGRAKGQNISSPKKKPNDDDGHGTFLAGIIAAATNNKKGVAGASFLGNLKIMPLKFDFTTEEAISAVNYAKARSIPVVNASWGSYGTDGFDPLLRDAIAAYPGVFITAAGNAAANHDSGATGDRMYPCDFELSNIICVAASDRNGNLTDYSDYGTTSVDVAAPGGTDGDPIFGLDLKKNKYTTAEGSSLSTAYVSAEAGLLLSKKPYLSAAGIIEIIKNSVDLEPSLTGKTVSGGKVNFQKALQLTETY